MNFHYFALIRSRDFWYIDIDVTGKHVYLPNTGASDGGRTAPAVGLSLLRIYHIGIHRKNKNINIYFFFFVPYLSVLHTLLRGTKTALITRRSTVEKMYYVKKPALSLCKKMMFVVNNNNNIIFLCWYIR